MTRFGARYRLRMRQIFRIGILIVLIAILILLIRSLFVLYEKNSIARQKRDETRDELVILEARLSSLESSIKKLETDRGLEEEIRTKFQVSLSGEETVIIVDDSQAEIVEEGSGRSFWQKVKSFLWFN